CGDQQSLMAQQQILELHDGWRQTLFGLQVLVEQRHGEVAQVDQRDRGAFRTRTVGSDADELLVERIAADAAGERQDFRGIGHDGFSVNALPYQPREMAPY